MFLFTRETLVSGSHAPFSERRSVRFQEVDAAGIIFYARLVEYFHDLYVSFLERSGSPLHEALQSPAWLSPVRHVEADFMKPLRFGDAVEVALVRVHAEPTEVTLGYRITRIRESDVAAVGQMVHTFLDPGTFRRIPIPESLLTAYGTLAGASGQKAT